MSNTLDFYNTNAKEFAESTVESNSMICRIDSWTSYYHMLISLISDVVLVETQNISLKRNTMYQLLKALKDGGIIYTSFKYGTFEGERNGRYFTDFTLESFKEFLAKIDGVALADYWITGNRDKRVKLYYQRRYNESYGQSEINNSN